MSFISDMCAFSLPLRRLTQLSLSCKEKINISLISQILNFPNSLQSPRTPYPAERLFLYADSLQDNLVALDVIAFVVAKERMQRLQSRTTKGR